MNQLSVFASNPKARGRFDAAPVVFVMENDISVHESLDLLICREGWMPAMSTPAQEPIPRAYPLGPCCLVFAIAVPDLGSLDLLKRVAANRRDMPFILVAEQCDVVTAVQAMKAGAIEVLVKPFNDEVLLTAIQHAIEQSRTEIIDRAGTDALRARYEALSSREREVMALVISGLMNKQVGWELGISEITVKAHRGRLMQKMEAPSFAHLVMMAATLGIKIQPLDRACRRITGTHPDKRANAYELRAG